MGRRCRGLDFLGGREGRRAQGRARPLRRCVSEPPGRNTWETTASPRAEAFREARGWRPFHWGLEFPEVFEPGRARPGAASTRSSAIRPSPARTRSRPRRDRSTSPGYSARTRARTAMRISRRTSSGGPSACCGREDAWADRVQHDRAGGYADDRAAADPEGRRRDRAGDQAAALAGRGGSDGLGGARGEGRGRLPGAGRAAGGTDQRLSGAWRTETTQVRRHWKRTRGGRSRGRFCSAWASPSTTRRRRTARQSR